MRQWYRGLSRTRRRLVIAGAIVVGLSLLVTIGLLVIYPRVGAWMIRDNIVPKLEARLGREVAIGDISIELGHAVLTDVTVRGPRDGAEPLVRIARVDVDFDTLRSFVGSAKIDTIVVDGVAVALRRASDGDNFRDVAERLGVIESSDPAAEKPKSSGGMGGLKPRVLDVKAITGVLVDERTGTRLSLGGGDASFRRDQPARANLIDIEATTKAGPGASIAGIAVVKKPTGIEATIAGGEIQPWQKMALTGITGSILPGDQPGRFAIELSGGYGGVEGKLWKANGWVARDGSGVIDASADKFYLDKLAPILKTSALVDYQKSSVDAALHVDLSPTFVKFAATMQVQNLSIGHPMIGDKQAHDITVSGKIAGAYDRTRRAISIDRGDFESRGAPFQLTGTTSLPFLRVFRAEMAATQPDPSPELLAELAAAREEAKREGAVLFARFVVPTIDCQKALDAIPREMVPYMADYKLRGKFNADIELVLDGEDLTRSDIGGPVGIDGCKVLEEPPDGPKRLLEEFEHFVEVEEDEWMSFDVGPSNPDFVPLKDVSPHLLNSLMSTEDSAFYTHRGFIKREFRTALIKNLQAGKFRYGASSITMQVVKNVLLYRTKTLARKLQELFLTWHIENVLEKDRLFEIYVNVIEYGPALYGIGPAARHYFGKHPRDLDPVEAAFFSSILPGPKPRYKQYCEGTLSKWTSGKIERILALMHKRKRLTDDEFQRAIATPLLFVKDGTETEKECLERTKKAIKNARPTNPMAK
jgi:hypothetical protein